MKKFKFIIKYLKRFAINYRSTKFSVITASYNSENYLDDYFQSILENNYKKIQIIFVDDGSTDSTKEIVTKYSKKLNIKYIYQKNKGQSAARNEGLKFVKGKFVTFIDSDDYVSENYFGEVNKIIKENKGKYIISTNFIYFLEKENKIMDTHPLNYRFKFSDSYSKSKISENPKNFQMSMNNVFFEHKLLNKLNLKLLDIKPQFEDAVFVNQFILLANIEDIIFSKEARYMYRKRSNGSSTLNKSINDKTRYTTLLENGYIYLLEFYSNILGKVPEYIQNLVIYDLSWNIKELENKKNLLAYNEIEYREQKLEEIFCYIDFHNIEKNWIYLWKMYLIGINNRYYNGENSVESGAYYFYETETYKKILLISIDEKWEFIIGNKTYKLVDLDYRVYEEKLNSNFLVNKYYVKLPKENFEIYHGGKKIKITNDRKYNRVKKFNNKSISIFFDRINKADDNAEIFYDYILKEHSDYKEIYFAIDKKCHDYKRLVQKGFKVIDYHSTEFIEMYKKADYIFSSAFDKTIENIDGLRYPKYECNAKFIFLQHGIITDDLSEWFSTKRVDKIITSCDFEFNNLVDKYTFFKEEVIMTGLPRFDCLYDKSESSILFSLTWRYPLDGIDKSNFLNSTYYNEIIDVICNRRLIDYLNKKNYELKFLLHPNLNQFLEVFEKYENETIKILNNNEITYRDEIAKSKILITDYSSIFADFCYLRKPVLFYQVDPVNFYETHIYDKELDYKDIGVGQVVNEPEILVTEVIKLIENGSINSCSINKKIDTFFAFGDKKNCERLFKEMIKN